MCDSCRFDWRLVPVGATLFTSYEFAPESGEPVERQLRRVEFDDSDDAFSAPWPVCEDCHRQLGESARWHAARGARKPDIVIDSEAWLSPRRRAA